MFLSDLALRRPVFVSMMILALVISGGGSYFRLGEDLFPKVSFPIISVTFQEPGTGARVIEQKLTIPLENALSTLPGIQHIHSVSVPGAATVTLIFPDSAKTGRMLSLVEEKVQQARHLFPGDVSQPVISRVTPTEMPLLWILFPLEDSGGSFDRLWLRTHMVSPIRALRGVSSVTPIWPPENVLHIWISPRSLSRYKLTIDSLISSIKAASLLVPTGKVIQGKQEFLVETRGEKLTPKTLENLPISLGNGIRLPLSRIASIEESPEAPSSILRLDGKPAVGFKIYKKPDANGIEVSKKIRKLLHGLTLPAGIGKRPIVRMDLSGFVARNNRELFETLFLGGALTVLVIFLFLGSWSSTIIASLAIPASVIATFAIMKLAHFTLNTLTMLGLSLVVGILVDDAIVVLENISRHREMGHDSYRAAREGVGEIGLAVLATTFSIVAVFVPVAFMKGVFGKFFHEFGLTVSFAVLMSMLVSLTLTPVLASKLPGQRQLPGRSAFSLLERGRERYRKLLVWSLSHPRAVLLATVASIAGVAFLVPGIGIDLVPETDQGVYLVKMTAGTSSSPAYADHRFLEVSSKIRRMKGVASVFYQMGGDPETPINQGYLYVLLKPLRDRSVSQDQSMEMARLLFSKDGADRASVDRVSLLGGNAPEIPLQLILMGLDQEKLASIAAQVAEKVAKVPGLVDVAFQGMSRQKILVIHPAQKKEISQTVSPLSLAHTLRLMLNEEDVATVSGPEGMRKVLLGIDPRALENLSGLESLPVISSQGTIVSLGDVAGIGFRTEGQRRIRDDRMPSVEINANLTGKQSLGKAIGQIETKIKPLFIPGYTYRFGGSGDVLKQAIGQFSMAILFSILAVYMVLASQFENFLTPLVIMVSIPVSVVGAIIALRVAGSSFNLMSAMGLIILFGLVAKNAILLVDYTNTVRKKGKACRDALIEACPIRFRPVLMTTLAMIAGMLPMSFGWGAGGALRVPMALVVIGGLLSSMLLTLIVVPVVYDRVNSWYDSFTLRRKRSL
jgi:HAE1 family hydrophobic/amphiphilic exporter-1